MLKKIHLEHVLPACRVALGQGRYTWRHNKLLTELAAVANVARLQANTITKTKPEPMRLPSKQGSQHKVKSTLRAFPPFLTSPMDWEVAVDLKGYGRYPEVSYCTLS